MLTLSLEGAAASTVSAVDSAAVSAGMPLEPSGGGGRDGRATPAEYREQVRHLLFGTPRIVQSTILQLHRLGYAEPNDWSRPISTGRPGEVMAILTKRAVGT